MKRLSKLAAILAALVLAVYYLDAQNENPYQNQLYPQAAQKTYGFYSIPAF